jgi:hypothetical protein
VSEGAGTTPARLWAGWPGTALRLAFAALPLLWLRRLVDLAALRERLGEMSLAAWLTALALGFASSACSAVRWRALLRAYGAAAPPSWLSLWRENVVADYFALLPSGLAGDALRGYRMRRHVDGLATSYTVIVVERVAGLVGLLVLAGAAVVVTPDFPRSAALLAFDAAALGALGAAALVLGLPWAMARRAGLRAAILRLPGVGAWLARIPAPRALSGLVAAVALSLLTQGFVMAAMGTLARAFAPALTVAACARVTPPIVLLGYIPLAPAGLGQREALYTYFFGLAGVPPGAAVAASLAFLSTVGVHAAVGGLLWLADRRGAAAGGGA